MAEKQGAEAQIELVAFDKREMVDDGFGNTVAGDWAEQFRRRARFTYLRGSETVMAARLEGRQPIILRVRSDAQTRTITADWRARDIRRGIEFNIRTVPPGTVSRQWIELLAESGIAI
jgi:head-tail adaptor